MNKNKIILIVGFLFGVFPAFVGILVNKFRR